MEKSAGMVIALASSAGSGGVSGMVKFTSGDSKMGKVSTLWRRLIVGLVTTAMMVGIAVQPGIANALPGEKRSLPEAQKWNPIDSTDRALTQDASADAPASAPVPDVVLPGGDNTSKKGKSDPGKGWRKAGDTPISVNSTTSADVEILSQDQAKALGVHGTVFKVSVNDASAMTEAQIDYSGFQHAVGGGYASRR